MRKESVRKTGTWGNIIRRAALFILQIHFREVHSNLKDV